MNRRELSGIVMLLAQRQKLQAVSRVMHASLGQCLVQT
jgi:hypothetical protein